MFPQMKCKMEFQIDTYQAKKWIQKSLPYVIIVVLMLLLLVKCNNTETLEIEKAILKNHIVESNKKVYEKIKENINIQKSIDKYKDTIAFLDGQNQKKQLEIQRLNKQRDEDLSKVSQYTDDQLLKFYVDRYKAKNEIFQTPKGIEFYKPITTKIALDLTDYDYIDNMLIETTDMLAIEKTSNVLKDSIINNLEVKEKNINFVVKEKDFIIDNQDEIIKNQEKSLKKEKRKNILYKYALPISIIAGIATGVIITK